MRITKNLQKKGLLMVDFSSHKNVAFQDFFLWHDAFLFVIQYLSSYDTSYMHNNHLINFCSHFLIYSVIFCLVFNNNDMIQNSCHLQINVHVMAHNFTCIGFMTSFVIEWRHQILGWFSSDDYRYKCFKLFIYSFNLIL